MKTKKYINRKSSRKYRLVILVLITAILGTFAPPLLSIWVFGAKTPLIILSGTEFTSLISILFSAYFTSNVFQRHVELNNGIDTQYTDGNTIEIIPQDLNTEDDIGKEA